MKYLVKFFVVTSTILICTFAFAEQNIVYIDMKFVLNNSVAGKGAQDFLKNSLKKNQEKFVNKEKKLKEDEKNLLAKKTILTKEEYKKQTDELRKKVMEYQSERKSILDLNQTYSISLAKNILKAETAALSAISIVNYHLNFS